MSLSAYLNDLPTAAAVPPPSSCPSSVNLSACARLVCKPLVLVLVLVLTLVVDLILVLFGVEAEAEAEAEAEETLALIALAINDVGPVPPVV